MNGKFWILLILLGVMVACRNETPGAGPTADNVETTATVAPTTGAAATGTPQATSSPTAALTPTPTETPEPPAPVVIVSDQALAEDGLLIVPSATILTPGWLVVYTNDDGAPGEILGYSAVATGVNEEVPIEVDPYQATPTLHVVLHRDDGRAGVFEFPGPDSTMSGADGVVSASFAADIQVFIPALTAADQEVTQDGQIVLDQVVSPAAGWVVLHLDTAGEPGAILGQSPVRKGENEDVVIRFNWRDATPRLHVVLHHDEGEAGRFDGQAVDAPVTANDVSVMLALNVTLPPDVFVINQPVTDGMVVVERAVVNEPAWLVVYTDVDGAASLIIGWIHLEAGVNSGLVIPVDDSAVTPVLHLVLHDDSEEIGEFDYPRTDDPLRYQGRVQLFSFRTNAGNYVIARDQALSEDGVVLIPLVVTESPTWIVVESVVDGELGEVLGQTWVPPGISRGVAVEIDPERATEMLYVTLVLDAGVAQEFEYPDGADLPLQRNRSLIRTPFRLTTRAD